MAQHALRPAIFFDRDGTLNREVEGALSRPEQLEVFTRAPQAIAEANAAGFRCVILTNQSAIARGWMGPVELERVHAALLARLAEGGARVDGIWHCPHLDVAGFAPYRRDCACRKPKPGLLLEAARSLALDLPKSWIIGDALRDLAAGAAVGVRGILVRSGKGAQEAKRLSDPGSPRAEAVVDDVLDAARFAILAAQGK